VTSRTLYRAVTADSFAVSSNGSASASGQMLVGRFAVYNIWSEIDNLAEGHFLERISPGSFSKSIRERGTRIPIMLSHGRDPALGMLTLGRLRDIREEADGVAYSVELFGGLPELLMEGLRSGTYGASFRAKLVKDRFTQRPPRSEHNPTGLPESVVTELALKELGPTPVPAYPQTSAGIRSLNDEFEPVRATTSRLRPSAGEPDKPVWELEESKPYWVLETKGAA
jgi:phage head maturation protease